MNRCVTLFKTISPVSYITKRTCSELPEGIQYPGFTYYPRDENFKDPPYEPSKLFFVKRIKSMKGRNPTERQALERLNIDGEVHINGHMTVVKNIPSINALLWKVKHLIEIRPIIVKGELPKDSDYSGTFLRHTGEFIVSKKLKVNAEQLEASEKFIKNNNQLSRAYIKEHLRKKWMQGFTAYE